MVRRCSFNRSFKRRIVNYSGYNYVDDFFGVTGQVCVSPVEKKLYIATP